MSNRRHCLLTATRLALAGSLVLPALFGVASGRASLARAVRRETGLGRNYLAGAPANPRLWQAGDPGERLHLRGRVIDVGGAPLPAATVEVWQADARGRYHEGRYRATLASGPDGGFGIDTVVPGYDYCPQHVHVRVTRGSVRLESQIMFRNDPLLEPQTDADLAILLERIYTPDTSAWAGEVELVVASG